MGSPHSEAPMVEQIITEFFAKSLHIILASRYSSVSSRYCSSSPSSSSSSSSIRPRDKWFNLALGDCPAALENMDLWGVGDSNFFPLVIDVILLKKSSDPDQINPPPGSCLIRNANYCLDETSGKKRESPEETKKSSDSDQIDPLSGCCLNRKPDSRREQNSEGKVIERWVIQYESRTATKSKSRSKVSTSGSPEMSYSQGKIYKKLIILLRSLYSTVRILPAYEIFKEISSKILPYGLAHRISSFVEPFTRVEDAEMEKFVFSAVETPSGRLRLAVSYLPCLENLTSDEWARLQTEFIPDYVGSPLTDPRRRFNSSPSAVFAPAWVSFTRRHSWSNNSRRSCSKNSEESPSPVIPDRSNFAARRSISFGGKNGSTPSSFPGMNSLTSLPLPSQKPARVLQDLKASPRLAASRFPVMDEFVNSGFFCPFVEDEDFRAKSPESRDRQPNINHHDSSSFLVARKSQGASVGELVVLLKSAMPLHHGTVAPQPHGRAPAEIGGAASSSSVLRSKTTFEALEELRTYREMKELLLKQGGIAIRGNPPPGDPDSLL